MTTKKCTNCLLIKDITQFHKQSRRKKQKRSPTCATCANKYASNTRNKLKQTPEGFLKYLSITSKYGAKIRQLEYDLTLNDLLNLYIKQEGKCAITQIELTCLPSEYKIANKRSSKIHTNISLDRIDNTKGYLKDNIQLVCHAINIMKQTFTMEEFKYWCNLVKKEQDNG